MKPSSSPPAKAADTHSASKAPRMSKRWKNFKFVYKCKQPHPNSAQRGLKQ